VLRHGESIIFSHRPTISVLIADDHAVVAEGLVLLIDREPGMRSSAHEGGDVGLLESCRSATADVLVMDLGKREPSVFEISRLIHTERLGARVLLLSALMTDALIQCGIDNGVIGFVSKNHPFAVLRNGILEVHAGRRFYCPEVSKRIVHEGGDCRTRTAGGTRICLLTNREREMLMLLSSGSSIRQVAAVAHISPKTVESHQFRIMQKLDIHNRIELARFAFREGIAHP